MKLDLDALLKAESMTKPDPAGFADFPAVWAHLRRRQMSDDELEQVVAAKGPAKTEAWFRTEDANGRR